MQKLSNPRPSTLFSAIPDPVFGATVHKFAKGGVLLFPASLLWAVDRQILVNLFSTDNELLESWVASEKGTIAVADFVKYFGPYEFSLDPRLGNHSVDVLYSP